MEKLDLEAINPELADIVLDVAKECDARYCDMMEIKLPSFKVKIVIEGHEIEFSNEDELERQEKERNELK